MSMDRMEYPGSRSNIRPSSRSMTRDRANSRDSNRTVSRGSSRDSMGRGAVSYTEIGRDAPDHGSQQHVNQPTVWEAESSNEPTPHTEPQDSTNTGALAKSSTSTPPSSAVHESEHTEMDSENACDHKVTSGEETTTEPENDFGMLPGETQTDFMKRMAKQAAEKKKEQEDRKSVV